MGEQTFNIESCDDTKELEGLMKEDAIGETMYCKRYVLASVMQLQNQEKSEQEKIDILDSIDEMTSDETSVCEFFLESGCLKVLLSKLASQSLSYQEIGLVLKIALNCARNDDNCQEFLSENFNFINLIMPLFYAHDNPVLLSLILASLKEMCETELIEGGPENTKFRDVFFDPDFGTKIKIILQCSNNMDLLSSTAIFMFSLCEYVFDQGFDLSQTIFQKREFLDAIIEAFEQLSQFDEPRSKYFFLEVLGFLCPCNPSLNFDISDRLCSVISSEVSEADVENETVVLTVAKVFNTCWSFVQHDESYFFLRRIFENTVTNPDTVNCFNETIQEILTNYTMKYMKIKIKG